jgi:hypothetical protein
MKFRPSMMFGALLACTGLAASAAPAPAPSYTINSEHPGSLKMTNGKSHADVVIEIAQATAAGRFFNHTPKWRKLNQRQIRKNRRRAHAAGKRHAFS